ncbi:MAG: hypothetical protein WA364_04515 [Candidatus Nitrosopolaris sp.]
MSGLSYYPIFDGNGITDFAIGYALKELINIAIIGLGLILAGIHYISRIQETIPSLSGIKRHWK